MTQQQVDAEPVARDTSTAVSVSKSASDPDAFAQQLNIRFKIRRANQARRLAASRGESIQEFFDRLVLKEVKAEQERLMKELADEERRVQAEREALQADLDS
jgi:hypothetical protein